MKRVDKVTVQAYTSAENSIGQQVYNVPDGDPVDVLCNVYPSDLETITALGLAEVDTRLIVADAWPFDLHAKVTYDGDTWMIARGPVKYAHTPSARSVQVLIQKA